MFDSTIAPLITARFPSIFKQSNVARIETPVAGALGVPGLSGSPPGDAFGSVKVSSPTVRPLFCVRALNLRNFGWPSSRANSNEPVADGPSLPAKLIGGNTTLISTRTKIEAQIVLFMGGGLLLGQIGPELIAAILR